ncbi:hypothetical protein [Leptotrichia sp. oral taxon 218]|uniref:hypothetical protein n=1 Tax=Leptotrichia sp. oral taxon 218 TaxID=712361 RepID=UPI002011791D|nr:hypothetical protein [Leptotrichia sp. oral taxon 218]
MIKLYKIKIGEKIYEVEVESVTEKEGSILTSDDFNNKQKKNREKKKITYLIIIMTKII